MDEDDVEAMLDKCEEQDDRLTSEERAFIDGCQHLLGELPALSEWRLERLTQIYNRVKDNG